MSSLQRAPGGNVGAHRFSGQSTWPQDCCLFRLDCFNLRRLLTGRQSEGCLVLRSLPIRGGRWSLAEQMCRSKRMSRMRWEAKVTLSFSPQHPRVYLEQTQGFLAKRTKKYFCGCPTSHPNATQLILSQSSPVTSSCTCCKVLSPLSTFEGLKTVTVSLACKD